MEVDLTCRFLTTMGFVSVVGFDAGGDEFLGAFQVLDLIEALEGPEMGVPGGMGSQSGLWVVVCLESRQLDKVFLSTDFKIECG